MAWCEIFPRNKSHLAFLTCYIHNIRTYTSCRSEAEFHMARFARPKIFSGWLKINTVLLKETWRTVDFCLNLQHKTELVLCFYLHLILFDYSCFHLHSFLSPYYVTALLPFLQIQTVDDHISLLQPPPLQLPLPFRGWLPFHCSKPGSISMWLQQGLKEAEDANSLPFMGTLGFLWLGAVSP